MTSARFAALAACLVSFACDGGSVGGADAGDSDAGSDSGPAVLPCTANSDCDDGVFCDGMERCEPGEPLADARGCTMGAPPCMATQTCTESMGCQSDCATNADADGDGYRSDACDRGDDCDDSDDEVNPGRDEICDPEGRNEDCDPATLSGPSETDVDEDGYVSVTCCNIQRDGANLCGLDCDDTIAASRPGYPESCDEVDNDCDGMIDERVRTTYYRDSDGDLYGDAADTTEACMQPDGYVASMGDCDDRMTAVHPTADEVCNLSDEDCDEAVDEDAPPGPESCGACGLVCPSGWTCTDGSCVDRVVEVDAGTNSICARLATGRVFCWGASDMMWSTTPLEIPGFAPASNISVGGASVCAVTGGTVLCWGRDFLSGTYHTTPVTIGLPGTAREVTVGPSHACAVTTDRSVYCWGDNAGGQLGDGTTTDRASPARVGSLGADEVSAGDAHTCARDGASVYCWGDNAVRQLGNGSTTRSLVPALASVSAVQHMGVGASTSCASTATEVYCWGSNDRGQAGTNPSVGTAIDPALVASYPMLATLQIDSAAVTYRTGGVGGGSFVRRAETCALAANDRVYCWADALPPPTGSAHLARQIPGLANVTSIATGAFLSGLTSGGVYTCAVDADGALYCWGYSQDNFLRTGDTGVVAAPSLVTDLPPSAPPIPR